MKISASGVRGVSYKSFNRVLIIRYTRALIFYIIKYKKLRISNIKIAVGSDARYSSKYFLEDIITELLNIGVKVYNLSLSSTPTLLCAIQDNKLTGGIMLTASHNPIQWNGIKIALEKAHFITYEEMIIIKNIAISISILRYNFKDYIYKKYSIFNIQHQSIELHIQKSIQLYKKITNKTTLIRLKNKTVILDPVNSSGGPLVLKFLTKLGCNVKLINGSLNAPFGRIPEPNTNTLKNTALIVKRESAFMGIALDPDADRIVFIDENGVIISEELSLAMSYESFLKFDKSDIVINLSTSQIIDDIASQYNSNVFRVAVGEVNIINGIKKYNCIMGGEGNGGIIFPKISKSRDPLVCLVLVLAELERKPIKISELSHRYSKYILIKEKVQNVSLDNFKIKNILQQEIKDTIINKYDNDGVKIVYSNYWIHIRKSNTEPIIRIFLEISKNLSKSKINSILEKNKISDKYLSIFQLGKYLVNKIKLKILQYKI